jgi:putative ABC transport system permease protein
MLIHLFKLIWNKKKQNFLLLLEIFIAFIGLFAAFTFVLYPYNNYKLPLGFEHENVWVVNLNPPDEIKNMDSLQIFNESVKKALLSLNGVENVAFSSVNFPLSGNVFNAAIRFNSAETWANFYTADDYYASVLGLNVQEGKWYSKDDRITNTRPAVINETLKKKLFGSEDALGKIVESDVSTEKIRIVGVVTDTKDESEAEVPGAGLFLRRDTTEMRYAYAILIKVNPAADPALESRMQKTLLNTQRGADIEIGHLTQMKDDANKRMLIPFIIFVSIAGFLIINVALGIFGVLWYNIHRRRGEIGLRRAVGATEKGIYRQLVTEAVLLATLSLILGTFFAIQFPLLGLLELPVRNYYMAIILAILFIYILVIICALYPGRQAATIHPAVALHED